LAVAASALVVPLQLEWVPGLRTAWGFNLWQYLPTPAVVVLALLWGAVCIPPSRIALTRAVDGVQGWLSPRWRPATAAVALVALTALFWLLRERHFFGDSNLLLLTAFAGWEFAVPDIGATWLLRRCVVVSELLGVDVRELTQALVCVFGALAFAFVACASRYLAPTPGRRAFLVAFALGGGTLRVFFGHVEVYAFVLACAGAYLWSALAYLDGRVRWPIPCLVLGTGVWMHLSFGFALPTLLVLSRLANPDRGRSLGAQLPRWIGGLALSSVPILAFLLFIWGTGHVDDLERAADKAVRILGFAPDAHVEGGSFVQLWGGTSTAGTDYVILSWPHLKYLVNDFFVLAPAAIPVLLCFGFFARRAFTATREALFLSSLCLCLGFYTIVVRPVWGPHDWDIFTLTAVCLATLSGLLLVQRYDDRALAPLGSVLIGATLAFVTIPLIMIGVAPAHDAGPFAHTAIAAQEGSTAWQAFLSKIAPWL
jgi:hypothetical protein